MRSLATPRARQAAAAAPRRAPARRAGAGRARFPAPRAAVATIATTMPSVDSGPFKGVTTAAQFKAVLEGGAAAGRIAPPLVAGFLDFYQNYSAAVLGAGGSEATVTAVMAAIADRVLNQFSDPYTFPSRHERMTAPYNYYEFGQAYVRELVDFSKSLVGHADRFARVAAQLAAGDNVVLLANHQTEADPAVWALLLEGAFPGLATDVAYVAGDRVVTDPLCKPFSMGRNLFCVHSKKYMDVEPELKEEKQKTNRRTVSALSKALGAGGALLWIAPSGGRDRPSEAGEWRPAPFDPAAVELMRQLSAKAAPPGHLWPLAMHSGPMMPPPPAVQKELGERRLTNHVGVGIALGEELGIDAIVAGIDEGDREARAAAVARAAYEAVVAEFAPLRDAVGAGAGAGGAFSQPWAATKKEGKRARAARAVRQFFGMMSRA